jgi:hypothetical protein
MQRVVFALEELNVFAVREVEAVPEVNRSTYYGRRIYLAAPRQVFRPFFALHRFCSQK